mmetsp:Transcript_75480/g.164669  ORF Transcript_75480/g.164669 Transcript_75480/m.164669 type:complete len:824 (-) Transcript_75480:141-2612(-)
MCDTLNSTYSSSSCSSCSSSSSSSGWNGCSPTCSSTSIGPQFLQLHLTACRRSPLCRRHRKCSPLLLVVALSASVAGMERGGSDLCPCIDGSDDENGIYCKPHNLLRATNKSKCWGDNIPDWCGDYWCYVYPTNCALDNSLSLGRANTTYSYSTCGYKDRYTASKTVESIKNTTLRAIYVSNSGGWKGNYCTGVSAGVCTEETGDGPVNLMLQRTFRRLNITLKQQFEFDDLVMEQALRYSDSPGVFDICPWATGMGFVELCVGSFVLTPTRTSASRLIAFDSESIFLVAPSKEEGATFFKYAVAAFRPFELRLWVVYFAAVIVIAMGLVFVERGQDGQFNPEDFTLSKALSQGIYKALDSLLNGCSTFEPQSRGGRLVSLGLSFLVMLGMASYTASLTSFMILTNTYTTEISSIYDVINTNKRVCIHSTDVAALVINKHFPTDLLDIYPKRTEVLTNVGGSCAAAVLRQEDFYAMRTGKKFCNLRVVGDPLYTVKFGIPVSPEVHWPLLHALTTSVYEGDWTSSLSLFELVDHCTDADTSTKADSDSEAQPLDVPSLLGPFMLTTAIATAGALVHLCKSSKPAEWVERRFSSVLDSPSRTSSRASNQKDNSRMGEESPNARVSIDDGGTKNSVQDASSNEGIIISLDEGLPIHSQLKALSTALKTFQNDHGDSIGDQWRMIEKERDALREEGVRQRRAIQEELDAAYREADREKRAAESAERALSVAQDLLRAAGLVGQGGSQGSAQSSPRPLPVMSSPRRRMEQIHQHPPQHSQQQQQQQYGMSAEAYLDRHHPVGSQPVLTPRTPDTDTVGDEPITGTQL